MCAYVRMCVFDDAHEVYVYAYMLARVYIIIEVQCLHANLLPSIPLLHHRRVYQILAYVLFFFNVIYGFVMCLLRLLGMVIFTIVMLFRMDHDVYMRGLEGWDTGKEGRGGEGGWGEEGGGVRGGERGR